LPPPVRSLFDTMVFPLGITGEGTTYKHQISAPYVVPNDIRFMEGWLWSCNYFYIRDAAVVYCWSHLFPNMGSAWTLHRQSLTAAVGAFVVRLHLPLMRSDGAVCPRICFVYPMGVRKVIRPNEPSAKLYFSIYIWILHMDSALAQIFHADPRCRSVPLGAARCRSDTPGWVRIVAK
jgi:hypothetical protein